MLTHGHDNFPSDVFTMMAGVGAKVTIGKNSKQYYIIPGASVPSSIPNPSSQLQLLPILFALCLTPERVFGFCFFSEFLPYIVMSVPVSVFI